jgi:hypothetical protein
VALFEHGRHRPEKSRHAAGLLNKSSQRLLFKPADCLRRIVSAGQDNREIGSCHFERVSSPPIKGEGAPTTAKR